MKIITFANEKGGVGKSTLAMHAAMGLALRGWRVMLLDADPQGNTTERCGLRMAPSLHDLIVRDAEWKDMARVVAPEKYGIPGEVLPREGALYIVPSNHETRNIASNISDATIFIKRLRELEGMVDAVIIDTSPTPSLLHGSIYLATDYIIYPTTCTIDSFRGLGLSIQHRAGADEVRKAHMGLPGVKILGIVPTIYRGNTVEQATNLKTLKAHYGDLVWPEMPQRTVWTETESQRAAVWSLEPGGAAAADAWELIDRIEGALRNGIAAAV